MEPIKFYIKKPFKCLTSLKISYGKTPEKYTHDFSFRVIFI